MSGTDHADSLPKPLQPAQLTDEELAATAEALTNTRHFNEEESEAIIEEGQRVLATIQTEMGDSGAAAHLGRDDGYASYSEVGTCYGDDDLSSVGTMEAYLEEERRRQQRVSKRSEMLSLKAKSMEDEGTFMDDYLTLVHYCVKTSTDRELLIETAHSLYNTIVVVEKTMQPNDPEELTDEVRNSPEKLLQVIKSQQQKLTHKDNCLRYHNGLLSTARTYVQSIHKDDILRATSDAVYQATNNRPPQERANAAGSRNTSSRSMHYSDDGGDDRLGEGLSPTTAYAGSNDPPREGGCDVM